MLRISSWMYRLFRKLCSGIKLQIFTEIDVRLGYRTILHLSIYRDSKKFFISTLKVVEDVLRRKTKLRDLCVELCIWKKGSFLFKNPINFPLWRRSTWTISPLVKLSLPLLTMTNFGTLQKHSSSEMTE